MSIKTVLLAAVLLVCVAANPPHKRSAPQQLVSIIALEEPCVRQGGVCMPIAECAPDNLATLKEGALCPMQRHLDVECCYV